MLIPSPFAVLVTAVASVRAAPVDVDPVLIDLMDRAREGSVVAFADLYDRYVDRVYGFVMRRVGDPHLAEDLTSEVFTRALRRIDSFTFSGVDPVAWLLTIARNRVHDHFRSARFRLDSATGTLQADVTDQGPAPERDLERAVVVREVQVGLAQLRPDHAEVLHLRFVEELTVAETAAVLGRKVGAVRALQFRAIKALAAVVDLEAMA
ncbi:hypothetical protein BH23ACT9_BH23ACT9_01790 [soil metagenome]